MSKADKKVINSIKTALFSVICTIVTISTICVAKSYKEREIQDSLCENAIISVFKQQYKCIDTKDIETINYNDTAKSLPLQKYKAINTDSNELFTNDVFEGNYELSSTTNDEVTLDVCVANISLDDKNRRDEQYIYRNTDLLDKSEFIDRSKEQLRLDIKDIAIREYRPTFTFLLGVWVTMLSLTIVLIVEMLKQINCEGKTSDEDD